MQGVAVEENGEQARVNFRVVGDFMHLLIGKIRGVLLSHQRS